MEYAETTTVNNIDEKKVSFTGSELDEQEGTENFDENGSENGVEQGSDEEKTETTTGFIG